MNFNSLEFLIFLPIVLLLYWILPHKVRWVWLLVASYYFYMSWNASLVFLILGTTLVSYIAAIVIERSKTQGAKKLALIITLVVCLGVLFFFKYFEFLLNSFVHLLNLFTLNIQDVALNILLPVGISFYTFQTLSYVIDVYRGKFKAERHFGYYALYVSYFPQLVAGPIERPQNLLPQLRAKHTLNVDDMSAGFRLMLCGFFRKCVIADFLGIYVNAVFKDLNSAPPFAIFVAGALFCFQMYCDFAGYSEIATGVARMMGVRLMRNFDRPYLATSYTEFFRRWHISLNMWFTDYVYIPLGGNRKGLVRKLFNAFVVFLLCGLWHGANWTYVLWGLYAVFFVNLESLLKIPFKKNGIKLNAPVVKWIRRVVMFLIFIPAALIFRAPSVQDLGTIFSKLFSPELFDRALFMGTMSAMNMIWASLIYLIFAMVGMVLIYYMGEFGRDGKPLLPLSERKDKALQKSRYVQRVSACFYCVFIIAIAWLSLISSQDATSFAYFQF